MYKSSLRHIHDPVLSSLKMKGIRLLLFNALCILSLFNGIDVGISHTCNTMRVKHDTIITCATADCFCLYLCFPTPSTTRPTRAYVTHMKDNVSRSFEPRHVIPDTRISSGQCPRCDVNGTWGARRSHEKASTKTYTCQKNSCFVLIIR
jgi:hypothetical protein